MVEFIGFEIEMNRSLFLSLFLSSSYQDLEEHAQGEGEGEAGEDW